MWSPFAESPPRSVAPASTSSGHAIRQVRRHLHPDVRHQPLALLDQPLDVLDSDRASPTRAAAAPSDGWASAARSAPQLLLPRGMPHRRPHLSREACIGDVGNLPPVVARVRDEVLQDDLLEVAVAVVDVRQSFERFDALVLRLADADEDPAR